MGRRLGQIAGTLNARLSLKFIRSDSILRSVPSISISASTHVCAKHTYTYTMGAYSLKNTSLKNVKFKIKNNIYLNFMF